MEKVPLGIWIDGLRQQVIQATQNYIEGGMPEPAFILEGIDVEATVETEDSHGGKLGFDIKVLTGELSQDDATRFTQKVTFRFKLEGDIMMGEKK